MTPSSREPSVRPDTPALTPPRQPRVGAPMNDSLDLHEITTLGAVALGESANGPDERGWWPVLALTDEAHPVVFECNLN